MAVKGISQPDPGKLIWCSSAPQPAAWHRKGRRHETREFREAAESETSILQTSPSTRVHRGWKRAWAVLRLRKNRPRSRATEARRGPQSCTWDTPSRWPPCRSGGPSCGTRARGRSWGRPRAASPPPLPSGWCWGRPACWAPRGTAAARRWSPAAGLLCVSASERGRGRPPSSREGWPRTGQWGSHPARCWSQFPPGTSLVDKHLEVKFGQLLWHSFLLKWTGALWSKLGEVVYHTKARSGGGTVSPSLGFLSWALDTTHRHYGSKALSTVYLAECSVKVAAISMSTNLGYLLPLLQAATQLLSAPMEGWGRCPTSAPSEDRARFPQSTRKTPRGPVVTTAVVPMAPADPWLRTMSFILHL